MGLKSDGPGGWRYRSRVRRDREGQAREVRNTMTAKSAIAATTISEPTIGAAIKDVPFSTTRRCRPETGSRQSMCSQPCTLARSACRSRNQAVVQSEQEQQHATDQIEVRVGRREREVLLDAHRDAGQHPDQ